MANIDDALLALTLEEEEDVPFILPNHPKYCSSEKNVMSIMGRTLNPACQNMADLILDIPRKWQVYDRVRGVALSSDRFQFIFKYEHDLEEVLRKHVWTFNEWSVVIDRWVEKPPENYLKFIPVWIQIRNIPVNYYTEASIYDLADIIGEVKEIAFDSEKPHSRDYVRVKVNFDVSRPVRRSKAVVLPTGETTTIWYDFERIQKRCYHCQRLTHEKDKCPILVNMRKGKAELRRANILAGKQKRELVLKEMDPLFGVLTEEQVGIDPDSGRAKINEEVLQEMRTYLLAGDGSDRKVREERVKRSIMELANNKREQNSVLRLEAGLVITSSLDKGKGPVYDQETTSKKTANSNTGILGDKMMSSAINAGLAMRRVAGVHVTASERLVEPMGSENSVFKSCSNGFEVGSSEGSSSGQRVRRYQPRRKNATDKKTVTRKPRITKGGSNEVKNPEAIGVSPQKRKAEGVKEVSGDVRSKIAKRCGPE
ncbi:uncharacterized protein LOC112085466 [Eutrema salsugineum]|uniref:uncharacterized protein LOC112085466 n=1 Tax=Eutrema salsugineum TaxID=72664 RepID=UPI000CED5818|nr:uncharacterized protein LOC112085466 [Eutrema salsugineum]